MLRAMRSPNLARAALLFLVGATLLVGVPAAFAPHSFYADFPFVTHWVELLPPYNEHLVTDVGGLYLGFAVIFAWAAWTLETTVVRAVCVAWLLAATLHLAFHASHLSGFSTADGIAEIASLALLLIPPPLAIWATAGGERANS
jgi:hypothetical protein